MHTGFGAADVRGTAGSWSAALGERPLVLEARVPMVMERRKRPQEAAT